MTAQFWWFVTAGALSATPFARAGLPRVRLLVGWLGAVMVFCGAIAVYYGGVLVAFAVQHLVGRPYDVAVVVWILGTLVVLAPTLALASAQRAAAVRQLADLR